MKVEKGDYVIAPKGCERYLTEGKAYRVVDVENNGNFFNILNTDTGKEICCLLQGSVHLGFGDWIIKKRNMKVEYNREQAEQLKKDFDLFLKKGGKPCGFHVNFESFLDHKFKPTIEVGKWYIDPYGDLIYCTDNSDQKHFKGYGLSGDNEVWFEGQSKYITWSKEFFQPAPDDLVISRMTDFVKTLYSVGDEVKSMVGNGVHRLSNFNSIESLPLIQRGIVRLKADYKSGKSYSEGSSCLMQDGKWATKIDPNKELKEEIERTRKKLEELQSKLR